MDGKEIDPAGLSGKNGRLELSLDIKKNDLVDEIYFKNYALQLQIKLDGDRAKNITAEGATIANQGSQTLLTYMVLPDEEKSFALSADVRDFELQSITASGLPLNMDVDSIDTSDVKDQVSDLQDGIRSLDDGASSLKSATGKFDKGTSSLSKGAAQIQSGIVQLASGAGQLADQSGAVMDGLKSLASGLSRLGSSSSQISEAGQQLTAGSKQLNKGLAALKAQLDALIASSEAIQSAIGTLKSAAGSVSGDISNLRKLIGVVSDYPDIASQYAKYIASARSVIGTMEALESGLTSLYGQYGDFHSALLQVKEAVTSLEAASEALYEGQAAYVEPVTQLAEGIHAMGAAETVSGAANQYDRFNAAVQQLSAGLAQLETSYKSLKDGIDELDMSSGKLKKGAEKLESGTSELRSETGDIDTRIDEEVDKALDKFKNEDFAPVSFVDSRNEVNMVQFVMKFDAIEAPDTEEPSVQNQVEDNSFRGKIMQIYEGWRSGS